MDPREIIKHCANPACKQRFIAVRKHQKYCSARCRFLAWFDRTYVKKEKA